MAVKYQNPPVIYTVAKLIFAESIGSYKKEKYEKLLISLEELGFDAYSNSQITGFQVKQADNQFQMTQSKAERVGYFSKNRCMCAIIDESTLELRLTDYTNHTAFLDTFSTFINLCQDNEIASGNKLSEVELHYVDLFVSGRHELQSMFSEISLPNAQFYSEDKDILKVGAIQFTRILPSGREKVSVNLEQLKAVDPSKRKYLPDTLIEPDQKLSMPIHSGRLFEYNEESDYAIVHTSCSSLINAIDFPLEQLRNKFEEMYQESRKTFDAMINSSVCNEIWKPLNQQR